MHGDAEAAELPLPCRVWGVALRGLGLRVGGFRFRVQG